MFFGAQVYPARVAKDVWNELWWVNAAPTSVKIAKKSNRLAAYAFGPHYPLTFPLHNLYFIYNNIYIDIYILLYYIGS